MTRSKAIIKQVDHIAIRSTDPHHLFQFLTDTLQLPVVWPMRYYGLALSGVVFAGNTNIEVFNYGSIDHASVSDQLGANIFAIAFEPISIPESLNELTRRTIPHSPPIPYHGQRFDGYLGKLWTNITLDGFLDGGSKSLDISRIVKGNPFLNHLIGSLIGKFVGMKWAESWVMASFGDRAIYLTEYTHDVSHIRSIGTENLQRVRGGLIGVEDVNEIILTLSDFDNKFARWEYLFSPIPPSDPGCWHLGQGPAIRLTPDEKDDIQSIVLRVKSLRRAKENLAKQDLLGDASGYWVSIAPSKIQELDIRLVE